MSYWGDRANERMASYHRGADSTINKINAAYDKAIEEINKDINKIFFKFQNDSGLSIAEAKAFLNSKVSKKEIESIRARIKYIKDENLRRTLMAEMNANAYSARITRLEALKESIRINSTKVADVELAESTKLFTNTLNKAYFEKCFDIQSEIKMFFNVAEMDKKLIEQILKSKWSGNNYSKLIWKNNEAFIQKLEEVLTSGFMKGTSIRKMAKEMEQFTKYGKFATERLIRTETTYIANAADMEAYKECGIERYIFLATLDLRTSKQCQDMDSEIVRVDKAVPGENLPPLHPYCRSTTRSYYKDIERVRIARGADGKTYTVKDINYHEWYDTYAA
ncbi:minor capsid protein [Clostridium culturomicium]|uniref:minor capsid protein n=1 Tax=Clostridium culturomicium TaxID=1499683 RepID=UPI003857C76D